MYVTRESTLLAAHALRTSSAAPNPASLHESSDAPNQLQDIVVKLVGVYLRTQLKPATGGRTPRSVIVPAIMCDLGMTAGCVVAALDKLAVPGIIMGVIAPWDITGPALHQLEPHMPAHVDHLVQLLQRVPGFAMCDVESTTSDLTEYGYGIEDGIAVTWPHEPVAAAMWSS